MDIVTRIVDISWNSNVLLDLVGQDASLRKIQVTLLKLIFDQILICNYPLFVLTSLKNLGDVQE